VAMEGKGWCSLVAMEGMGRAHRRAGACGSVRGGRRRSLSWGQATKNPYSLMGFIRRLLREEQIGCHGTNGALSCQSSSVVEVAAAPAHYSQMVMKDLWGEERYALKEPAHRPKNIKGIQNVISRVVVAWLQLD